MNSHENTAYRTTCFRSDGSQVLMSMSPWFISLKSVVHSIRFLRKKKKYALRNMVLWKRAWNLVAIRLYYACSLCRKTMGCIGHVFLDLSKNAVFFSLFLDRRRELMCPVLDNQTGTVLFFLSMLCALHVFFYAGTNGKYVQPRPIALIPLHYILARHKVSNTWKPTINWIGRALETTRRMSHTSRKRQTLSFSDHRTLGTGTILTVYSLSIVIMTSVNGIQVHMSRDRASCPITLQSWIV